jgi:TolA-binding protein
MTKKVYKKILVVLLFAFSLPGCAYYNTFYNAKKFYNEASKQRKERLKTQVVELSPEEREQLKKQGLPSSMEASKPSTQEMQSYEKAIEKASKVLEFYPNSKLVDDALLLLGECFFYRQEYSKAERKFQEIVQLYPNSKFVPRARLLMAKTQLGLENFDRAEEQFREIADDDDINKDLREEAAYELGGLYYEKGAYDLAANEYRKTARNSDDKLIKAMSLYRLGECLISLEEYSEAPKIFADAVKQSPNEDFKSQATFKLGESYQLLQDYDKAVKTFSELLSKEYDAKRIPRIKLQLAENLRHKGELDEALKWYTDIIEEHKKTDASARSYFALGEIEQYLNKNYKKAKENYDLVRGEFPNSLIAPEAKQRADNIQSLLDLLNTIAALEGRSVQVDSLVQGNDNGNGNQKAEDKDDAPIDLSLDGLWVNYTGRDRPPPKSLAFLSTPDLEHTALPQESVAAAQPGDSLLLARSKQASAPRDSAALVQREEETKKQKKLQLFQKKMALAELLLFSFNMPDSSIDLYRQVAASEIDSALCAKALYSQGYIYKTYFEQDQIADSVYRAVIEKYPDTPQAEGARKALDLPLAEAMADTAALLYHEAERTYLQDKNYRQAIDLYKKVADRYPDSEFAVKARFAIGWIYENDIFDYELAASNYQSILDDYPNSPYAKVIKPKFLALDKAKKEEQARLKSKVDSTQKASPPIAEPSATVTADSTAQPQPPDSLASAPGDTKEAPPAKNSARSIREPTIQTNRGQGKPPQMTEPNPDAFQDSTGADAEKANDRKQSSQQNDKPQR